MRGEWPTAYVDHINGDGADNRIGNLRAANNSENLRNRGPQANNTSGAKGVYRERNRWCARIEVNGQRIRLGAFATVDAAAKAYADAASRLHGEFARIQ